MTAHLRPHSETTFAYDLASCFRIPAFTAKGTNQVSLQSQYQQRYALKDIRPSSS
jgi:hypothetical protein